jgi:hypothetical protein
VPSKQPAEAEAGVGRGRALHGMAWHGTAGHGRGVGRRSHTASWAPDGT